MSSSALFVGIDLGTSGCRAVAIDHVAEPVAAAAVTLPLPLREGAASEQDPELWWRAVVEVLQALCDHIDTGAVRGLSVDGTSGTLLVCDAEGTPVTAGLMYNDARAHAHAEQVAAVAPLSCGAHGPTASLAKLLYLKASAEALSGRHALHQAEWIAGRFTGRFGWGDENNCLKLGYDVLGRCWPAWLNRLGVPRDWLPEVSVPGTDLGRLDPAVGRRFGFAPECRVRAGTTDSMAAFLATGAAAPGEAMTSLGSTLVLKILSDRPVFDVGAGVYSHRLGGRWLVGGASNSGGAVLRHYFTRKQLEAMTPRLNPEQATGLDYYPLLAPGERFPVSDPNLAPRLAPRPAQAELFFQGLLEGIARIEAAGYRRLADLGAPAPLSVRSVGGGAANAAWTRIRARELKVPMIAPRHSDAAYGAALLAAGRIPA